jgi:tetratricopeptide (TPR) repeat protein
VNLVFIYPRWHIDAAAWWQYLFPLAAVVALALLWLWRGRIGKGPLVAVLFFAGVLLPTLGFVNFYFMRMSFVADHFLYLPSAGLLALAAALLVKARQRFPDSSRLFALVATAVLLFLGGATWMQERHFASQEALWTDTLAKNSECWLAHNNLGNDLMNRGEDGKAFHHLNAALALKPDYDYAHYNLGVLLARHGKLAEAGEHLREALRLAPDSFNAREHLGWVCQQQHNLKEAARYLVEETERHPDSAHAFYLLGTVREEQQNWSEACACLRRACELQPQESLYQEELSKALRQKN